MAGIRVDGAIARQFRTLVNLGPTGDLTDGQLLERFATDRGEAGGLAFEALVGRHEALVWRACRAILGDEHRAEDAFQATFLVLARRGRSLWVRDSLGPWLHQVACRTARCLRAADRRRLGHERRLAERAPAGPAPPESRDLDLAGLVHEAVDRLPGKYRAPIILCDLEGRTHAEAARALGWPIGTVKSRQAQGRQLLRARLIGRGLPALLAAAAVEAVGRLAGAAVPHAATRGVVAAALGRSSGAGLGLGVATPVLTLAGEVGRGMAWAAFRPVAAATLALGVAAGAAGLAGSGGQAPAAPGAPPAAPQQPQVSAGQVPPAAEPAPPPEDPAIRAKLRAQELATRRAKLNHEIATLTREIAQIAVAEYDEATFPNDLVTRNGEIALAKSDLKRAEDRANWSRQMHEKGYVSQATKIADELSFKRAKFELETAETQLQVLERYTRDKQRKSLRSDVARAEADELAKQAAWDQERAKQAELERQLRPAPR